MKKKELQKAVYPGSFDPITLGHVDIIRRISQLYDEVTVLIAHSPQKESLFTIEEREQLIKKSLADVPNIKVDSFSGLTVDYLRKNDIRVIVRGLRAVVDFEYELSMANINKKLAPEIETILVFASPEYYFVSSRAVKEVARNKGNLSGLVPEVVQSKLLKRISQ